MIKITQRFEKLNRNNKFFCATIFMITMIFFILVIGTKDYENTAYTKAKLSDTAKIRVIKGDLLLEDCTINCKEIVLNGGAIIFYTKTSDSYIYLRKENMKYYKNDLEEELKYSYDMIDHSNLTIANDIEFNYQNLVIEGNLIFNSSSIVNCDSFSVSKEYKDNVKY